MLKKRFLKSKCKVTFEVPFNQLPQGMEVEQVSLVGDFNDWDKTATPLRPVKRVWKELVDLELDQSYQYRYLINEQIWYNDWEADSYVANNVDGDNCIVRTSPA